MVDLVRAANQIEPSREKPAAIGIARYFFIKTIQVNTATISLILRSFGLFSHFLRTLHPQNAPGPKETEGKWPNILCQKTPPCTRYKYWKEWKESLFAPTSMATTVLTGTHNTPFGNAGGVQKGAQKVCGAFPDGYGELHRVVRMRQSVPAEMTH
jgi:hypothetical protein